MNEREVEALPAVVMHLDGLRCDVRLEDGRVVVAHVSKRVARRMFRIVPGDKVMVSGPGMPQAHIIGFAPGEQRKDS